MPHAPRLPPRAPGPAAIAAALAFAVLVAFAPVVRNEFVNYDDNETLTSNPRVLAGLTWEGVRWAFTSIEFRNWQPIAWVSHQVDFSLFGARAGAHHTVSALLHAANAALLFGVLLAMTGTRWRSALAAAAFALHPLRVESVAWASERKDGLFLLFCLLSLAAWLRHLRARSRAAYAASAALFACALMSKALAMTLPALMLLLDVWPLGRWPLRGRLPGLPPLRLVAEKIPFIALAAAAGAVAFHAQRAGGAIAYAPGRDLAAHVGNAVRSSGAYLLHTAWPAGLAVFYPPVPEGAPLWQTVLGAAAVAGVTVLASAALPRRPALAVGWAWYLVALAPVSGLVQAGPQAMADRFTYLPHVGLLAAAAWGVADAVAALPRARAPSVALAFVAAISLSAATWAQVSRWRTSETLFRHALAVTERNYLAMTNLASALAAQGRQGEAQQLIREAYRANPVYRATVLRRSADYYAQMGKTAEAVALYREALALTPDNEYLRAKLRDLEGAEDGRR